LAEHIARGAGMPRWLKNITELFHCNYMWIYHCLVCTQ